MLQFTCVSAAYLAALKRILLWIFVFSVFSKTGYAAVKLWTGSAGDSLWSTAANWDGNSLPLPEDDVVFDHSFLSGDYRVKISGTDSILVNSLVITPGAGQLIEVWVDTLCSRQVSLSLTAAGYSMIINAGGSFRNASRVSSGAVISMTDSLQINNGGSYIHATRRPHAAIVAKLSRIAGTEHGVFEFDLPPGAGTLSISNRVYGDLVLSAKNAGGVRTYTGTGSNPLTINGDFIINDGVSVSVDLASANGNIVVKGKLQHHGVSLNLASGAGNITTMKIAGDISQSAGSLITETNTGFPVIELNGSFRQQLSLTGTISNQVAFRINNPAGVVLESPLSLPYVLELLAGYITTTASNLLILQAGCGIIADSTANNNFINGPLRKEGLSATGYFLFPVGKGSLHWLELKNATGNFTVEYMQSDPTAVSDTYGSGIDHLANSYYWMVNADASPAASASAELSFADAGGIGATEMNTLRVAQLYGSIWLDRNNIATTGTAGAAGSVTSEVIDAFGPEAGYFALADNAAGQAPLPITLVRFTAVPVRDEVVLNWKIDLPGDSTYFTIMGSADNQSFYSIDKIPSALLQTDYQYTDKPAHRGTAFYRLQVTEKNGNTYFSKIVRVMNAITDPSLHFSSYSVVGSSLGITISSPVADHFKLLVMSGEGRLIKQVQVYVRQEEYGIAIDVSSLPAGMYYVVGVHAGGRTNVLRFIKQ